MHIYRLSTDVIEKLGYYVYLYINPIDNRIFYVGKGKGNRVLTHLSDGKESEKVSVIRKIHQAGLEPIIEILVHGLQDEETALRIEAAVIDLLGVDNLTNSVRGWQSSIVGRIALDDLVAIFERKSAEIDDPVILIRINQLYHYGMTEQELYEATRGIWKIGDRRNRAHYAFAVYGGIVREVYRIKDWHPAGSTNYHTRDIAFREYPDRWEFTAVVAPENIRTKYINKSVENYIVPNAQNPIAYVNC